MADPRFFDNRGPFGLASLCAQAALAVPGVSAAAQVHDVESLAQAGRQHLSFFAGGAAKADFARTAAGFCIVPPGTQHEDGSIILVPSPAPARTFAEMARALYPDSETAIVAQEDAIHPSARLDESVIVAPGAVIGPGVEIGRGSRIGANAVIGRGVAIGQDCEIGAQSWIGFSLIGDRVIVQPGARLGASGFGFASDASGHVKIPQLGRVIVQDHVEIGANSTIDRGALGDTVIGEGSKIDNLVQIGHNTVIGRHCVIAGHVGISGSVRLGDFVAVGGGAGIADHVVIGDGARIAGMAGVAGALEGGREYGGIWARPVREWQREMIYLAKAAKNRKRSHDE